MATTLVNLQSELMSILAMPQNQAILRGVTPEAAAMQLVQEVRTGFVGEPRPVEIRGSVRLLRGTGAAGNPFGRWWFPENLLWTLRNRLDSWPFPEDHRKAIQQRQLREGLAISVDWNRLSELWCLELPAGDKLRGLVGVATSQPVVSDVHDPRYDATWKLRGGEVQYFFPVVNPLWVRKYS
jgi:hypothetical protein